jgi:UDP-N-acetylmuramate dehydrogenase
MVQGIEPDMSSSFGGGRPNRKIGTDVMKKRKSKNIFSFNVKKDIELSSYTTLGIGGPAKYLREVKTQKEIISLIKTCKKNNINYIVIGEGSDLLVSDHGFDGLVIVNKVRRIKHKRENFVVQAGTNLQKFIDYVIKNGYQGIEKMSGIPGSVGGAIFGNAGAYGQTISDKITTVKAFDGKDIKKYEKKACKFDYRESLFKRKRLIILEAEFVFEKGNSEFLQKIKNDTIALRQKKYPSGLRCPGSFYKNVEVENLTKNALKIIPRDKILYGKIPAGYLMQTVGANGKSNGGVRIADYHGNLIINENEGTAEKFLTLANTYAKKVKKKYGIRLEPEVQLVGFENEKKRLD